MLIIHDLKVVALFNFCAGTLIVSQMCRIGVHKRLLDTPNSRSSHVVPTPRGGGIGIVLAFLASGILFSKQYPLVLIGTFAGVIGFISDISKLSSLSRLFLHGAVSMVFLLTCLSWQSLNPLTAIPLFIFLLIFLIGSANIYNFMDGINGIAAITALAAFGFLAYFSRSQSLGGSWAPVLAVAIVFSTLGFLPFNVPVARIFMGDVGSLFLGFIFAAMTIVLSKHLLDFLCISSFLFTFYADEIVTMAIRLKNRENLFIAHRKHFYQVLANEFGIIHWQVSLGYGVVQAFISIHILSLRPYGPGVVAGALMAYFIVFCIANAAIRCNKRIRVSQ
jgi:UDP-N-acetylmuramyl pentapeptide phosphotransferase/UDP-N-acetylglucosamine-1-phosphate transferase